MNNKFSENLKKIRKEHNLSQEQLADEIGVSRQAISKWESAVAYPEMDKIITLCDKFNVNIDDLLHKNINEVKGEEESKKKINRYIDDFLRFITNAVNLFVNMNFKSKIKCLFEQILIIIILLILSNFISSAIVTLFSNILKVLPSSINHYIIEVFNSVIDVACVFVSIIILAHIFKTRYLDYYIELRKKKQNDSSKEIDKNNVESKTTSNEKIIIRDPKHSEHNFINGLFKLIILIIKFFLLGFGLFIAFALVCLFGSFIAVFQVYKTGAFFIGLVITILSSAVICLIIILLILNFVFNRKNKKKLIIWSIIIAIITFGIGCGLTFSGSLKFNVSEINEDMLKNEIREHEMNENLLVYPYNDNIIEYIESDNENVRIEYSINKYCDITEHITDNNTINAWSNCNNPTKIAREFLKNINQRKLVPISNTIEKITIYTTSSNIDVLKNNMSKYNEERIQKDDTTSYYEEKINELEEENSRLKVEIKNLQEQSKN